MAKKYTGCSIKEKPSLSDSAKMEHPVYSKIFSIDAQTLIVDILSEDFFYISYKA